MSRVGVHVVEMEELTRARMTMGIIIYYLYLYLIEALSENSLGDPDKDAGR